jgi:hypothetical protein
VPIDYTSFDKQNPKHAHNFEGHSGHWWKESRPLERAQLLVAAADELKERSTERSQSNLRHAKLYGNFDAVGFGVRDYTKAASAPTNKIALNVVASCVDTLNAKIAKNRPRPSFQTDGGNWKMQQKAKRLDKFTRGLFYEAKIYQVAPEVFLDSLIFDIAAMKVFIDPGTRRLKFERIFPDELFVDDTDGLYGTPRQLFQRKIVAKELLLAEFGEDKALCEVICAAKPPADAFHRGFGDCVEVWEAWHLPSGPDADDGLHVIAMQGAELFKEEWKRDYFPFAFQRFTKRRLGFWGQGLVERLSGIQVEINRLLRSITEQLRRKGRGRIFVPIGSKVVPAHMTNGIADIVFYAGNHPPVIDSSNAVAQEEFMQLERLRSWAYQEAGISELSAGAKKPSGLDAAVAMREFNDIETERFAMQGKNYEQFFLDATEIALDLINEASESGYKVRMPDRRFVEEIDWKDIDFKRDAYVMQMFPVSSLPQTPSHRLQRVRELMADGFVADKGEARRLLDFPDLDAESHVATAALDDVDATISRILDDPKPKLIPPDEFQNLPLLVQRAQAAYLRGKNHGAEPERLNMLRRLIDQASNLLLKAQEPPPQAAPPMGPEMMPPGGPGMMGPGGPGPMIAPTVNMDIDPNFAPPVAPVAPPVIG